MAPVAVAIFASREVEEEAIVRALGNCRVLREHGLHLHLGGLAGQQILVCPIGGMGNPASAQIAQRVIDTWSPARLVLVGIAGGNKDSTARIHRGDIVIPDQVVGYELAKVTQSGTSPRYEVYRPDAELLACARSLRPADWTDTIVVPRPGDPDGRVRPLVHVAPVLAGEKVLADDVHFASLRRSWPTAIGIEMEGLGIALAAHRSGPGFLVVKAVSDFADSMKDDSWRRYAADASARFAVAVLARSSLSMAGGGPDQPPAGPARTESGRSRRPAPTTQNVVHNVFSDQVDAEVIGFNFATRPRGQS